MTVSKKPLFYEFADFRVDAEKHIMWRGNDQISLTPKVFETLLVFLEHQNQVLDKSLLMSLLWTDSFVEESSLTQNVAVLRKVLGEKPKEHKFILTIPGQGYRFVADVNQVFAPQNGRPDASHQEKLRDDGLSDEKPTDTQIHRTVRWRSWLTRPIILMFAAAIAIASVVFVFSWRSNFDSGQKAPVLLAEYSSELLSTDGKVIQTALSPDGKFVIYAHIEADDMQSIWLRNLATGHNAEIISRSNDFYFGLEFSPDAKLLYLARKPRNREGGADIFQVSISGGIPQKIVGEAQGWMSISPDGSQIAFVRCYYQADDNCSLWTADSSDGRNERKLVTRPQPFRIRDIDYSPDGMSIAFASGQSENQGMDFSLSAFNLTTGTERELSPEKFFNITGLAWLPNSKSLLITASRIPIRVSRVWHVETDTGTAEPLTQASESYLAISVDRTGSAVVVQKYDQDFRIRAMDWDDASESLVLLKAAHVSYAPDGRLFFSSGVSGNPEIWCVNANGSGRKQLTDDSGDDQNPVVGPDNNSVYFASNRTGSIHVWRMNADGSNQTQITRETGGFPLSTSLDGDWVYFHHGLNRSLWRVSVRDGEEQVVLSEEKQRFAISPDRTRAAYAQNIAQESFVFIISLSSGQKVDQLRAADPSGKLTHLAWLADGSGVAYILAKNEFRINTVWLQTFEARESSRKIVEIDQQIAEGGGFAVAPDGRGFAVSQGEWLHDAVLIKGLK